MCGASATNFVEQIAEAGLNGRMGFYTQTNPLDDQTLPGIGDGALGIESAGQWSADLDNPANRAFTAHFRAKYGRRASITAANAYDGARLLDAALRQAGGKVEPSRRLPRGARRGAVRSGARQVPLQHEPLSDPEFLSLEGRARP